MGSVRGRLPLVSVLFAISLAQHYSPPQPTPPTAPIRHPQSLQAYQSSYVPSRQPYPTQSSYRQPQRRLSPRPSLPNHVPILTRPAPTRFAPTMHTTTVAQRNRHLKAEQERRRLEEHHRKTTEKLRLDQERRRLAEEKKRNDMDRRHRDAVEAAERMRVEQARLKAVDERKRSEDEQRRRADEEHRRKIAEAERLRQASLQPPPPPPHAQPIQVVDPRFHYDYSSNGLVSQTSPSVSGQCDIPPDLWCDSHESSVACGVEQQCSKLRRKPIKITLIYEALCPFCQRFISNQLGTVFNSLRGHFELEMIPWGNSRLLPDGSFSCNHGKKECDANRLQSCVLDVLQVKGALPFIVCFEKAIFSSPVEQAMRSCSAFIRSHEREIRHCYETDRGVQLQRIAAQKTLNTRPQPIVEVPYLLINDYSPTTENNDLNVMLFPQLLGKWTRMFNRK